MYLLMKASRTKQDTHVSSKTYSPYCSGLGATAKYHKWDLEPKKNNLFLIVAKAGRSRLRCQYGQGLEKSEAETDS